MLEHLFGSRTRVKLLTLFIRHPDDAFFVREITRRVATQINAVRRELANLVLLGLLKEIVEEETERKSSVVRRPPGLKKKFYKLNPSFALLSEVQALVIKAQILLERHLDKQILKLGDIKYLAFLGVFMGRSSPVDVFIIGQVNHRALEALLAESEKELGFEMNFSVMTPEEFVYRKDITDRFLYAILESPKHVLVDRLSEHV